jgi:beta-lactamase class A
LDQVRLNYDNKLIHPLVLSNLENESDEYNNLKSQINQLLETKKQMGILTDASVYYRKLSNGSWFSINGDATYYPGSLVKMAVMITYLKLAESNPGLLMKEFYFDKPKPVPHQSWELNPLKSGRYYTIKELLYYMVVNSDNSATEILNSNISIPAFKKTFTDLGLAEPPVADLNYQISPIDYSRFIRVLYNASYLNDDNSELALEWLTECSFRDGMVKNLPQGIKVSHKFGEFGLSDPKQLHECGIFFCNNTNYLLTVMTKGKDVKSLATVLSDVSKLVFDHVSTSASYFSRPIEDRKNIICNTHNETVHTDS